MSPLVLRMAVSAAVMAAIAVLAVALAPSSRSALAPPDPGAAGRAVLAGPWTVRGDRAGHGIKLGWPRGTFSGRSVAVPFSPNAAHITGARGERNYEGSVAWYSTRLEIPVAGDWALDFGSVNHRADVWLDGRLLGTHRGVYLPFEERFAARPGEHVLVVRADYRDPARLKQEAWHRTWFNFGGINRRVTLRALGASDVTDPTVRTRLDRDGTAEVDVGVHIENRGPARSIAVAGRLMRGTRRIALEFPPVSLAPGATTFVRAHVRIPAPALWAPGHPALYDLDLGVVGESGWHGRTGLRELTWRGRGIFLNGRRLILRGASLQEDVPGRGDALSGADMDALVADLKAIGANATRAQHPLSPALLDRLDAAGIMVWQGIGAIDAPGSWTSKTPALRRQSLDRIRASVRQLQAHPSVVTWGLANEVAGRGHPGGQARFIDAAARELHARDPSRPVVVGVWGTHAPKNDHTLLYRHVDLIGATNYVGWYEATRASRPEVARLVRRRVAHFERVFADKALVIAEFGAEASPHNGRGVPGSFGFQTRLLSTHIRAYEHDRRLSGMLVWLLRDFAVTPEFAGGSIREIVPGIHIVRGLNQKGLFTYGGRAKPAVAAVGAAFRRLGRGGR